MLYPSPASVSRALYERATQFLPGGNTRTTVYMKPYPIYVARGAGSRIWDVDGDERIDCINNFTAQIHGHAHPVINEAVRKQLELGTCFGLPTEAEIDLAELLCGRVRSVQAMRFTNSGTEAVMMAMKAARAFTGRPKIAKVEGAYHGSYDYAEVSLDPSPANWGADPSSIPYAQGTPQTVLQDVVVLPFNNPEAARRLVLAHRDTLAAIVVDPMPNRAGLVPASAEYIQALRAVADEIGALLIFDEVISFRLGHGGAQPLWGVEADLTTFGKIIGGGFPVGAVGGRRDVMAVFDPSGGKPVLPHGGTFSANPVSMRAGIAALQLLDHAAFTRLAAMGDRLRAGINAAFARHGVEGQAVGMGSLLKVHLTAREVVDYRTALPHPAEAHALATFMLGLLNRGVFAASYGLMALSTPMTEADIDHVIGAADEAIGDVARSR
ncbi:aspartate aminotransferase family protein [Acetobacter sp. TBRC 12305]|uniref:Glutamate-1-semialdehyde 2,1-aminomutase n=1 Tax=Acetobacter garciniae TaxID=2817435 RepID=A0A939HH04_9PROT|nr:aspartate aminotransferase family protein [Acetobacter garciniae]MBO1324238.1 aspartate aminotransferase family protein [Acetobacter garciniae]MBX0343927.1 aspartate aminotransferase family protein [Acetobacter garciniae]